MTDMSNKRIHALIPDLLRLSRHAGKAILDVYQSDFAIEHKEDRSPLTLADRRSHEVITEGIASLRDMQLPVLSEEGKTFPTKSGDPGTSSGLLTLSTAQRSSSRGTVSSP